MIKISITRKLVLLFFIVGVSALTIVGAYSYFNAKDAILKRTLDQLTSIRVIKKGQIEFLFKERFTNLSFLSNTDYIKNLVNHLKVDSISKDEKNIKTASYFNSIKEKIDYRMYGFSNMFILFKDNNKNLQINTVLDSGITKFNNDSVTKSLLVLLWQKNLKTDSLYIIDFKKRFDKDNEPVCLIGKSITDYNGKKIGILALQIPLKAINDIMLEDSKENGLGESGEIYLVGQDYLMRSNSRFIPNSVLKTIVHTVSARNAFKDKVGNSLIDDYRTIAVLSSFDKIDVSGLNWAIIAEIDYAEAMVPIVSLRNDILFLSSLICIFLFSIAHIISRSITQPIIRLKNATVKIGEGNFNVNLKPSTKDEIGLLTEAFNTMSSQLKDERLKRMSALYDGQEIERQRISRELHDSLGQKLIAIKLLLESTTKQCGDVAKNTIDEIKTDFYEAIDEVREISNNLAPNVLKESGIDVAIKNLCESIQHSSKIEVDFSSYGDYFTNDNKMKTYIYRIAQEGLNNAMKHSEATSIHVQLMGNKENIILVLEDNGKGFTFDKNLISSGNGLYNMKERANLLNASLDIESEQNSGTTIRLKIPKNLL